MFPCDGPHIFDIFNFAFVFDHPDSDGIFTDLRGNVALHLKAQVFQNQVSCKNTHKNP